jgi:hypothetical protein
MAENGGATPRDEIHGADAVYGANVSTHRSTSTGRVEQRDGFAAALFFLHGYR